MRCFGFVVQNSTGTKAFVHISALADRGRRPVVGALVTYEVGNDERGRPRAINGAIRFPSHRAIVRPMGT
jgi:cold shock CspA family protein